jgi:hypothetical protein
VPGVSTGVKPKDLIGIPWMVAFALRADGWYLRSDIIWNKPNPMPESVTDRPTKAHEYVFLLSKGPRYFYDADAIREDGRCARGATRRIRNARPGSDVNGGNQASDGTGSRFERRPRQRWPQQALRLDGRHPAPASSLTRSPASGTTGLVALRHDRSFIGCELSPAYVDLARDRIIADSPLLNTHAEAA